MDNPGHSDAIERVRKLLTRAVGRGKMKKAQFGGEKKE